MVRIAVVDDHPVARVGLSSVLTRTPDFTVVAAVDACAALPRDVTGAVAADLVVLDLYLDGQLALREIAELARQVPVLIVSASGKPADVLAAVRAGASGYLTKHARESAYEEAVRAIGAGEFHLSPHLADLLHATSGQKPVASGQETLSERERQTLVLIAEGFTHAQVARRMAVSRHTVETYVARIRRKLGLGNKAELALAAIRHSSPPPDA